MSMFNTNEPRTPSGRMGDDMEKTFLAEAERERLAKEADEAHADEAEERVELGEASAATPRPWWKFWA